MNLPLRPLPQPPQPHGFSQLLRPAAAAHLASHGYVVVASDFISEGSLPTRKSVGDAVLTYSATGPLFRPLGWGEVDGIQMFIPGFIRNYSSRSWLDYYLKGDESGLRFCNDPIPELDVLDVRSEITQR